MIKLHCRHQNNDDLVSEPPKADENDVEEGEISSEENEDPHLKKSSNDVPQNELLCQMGDGEESKTKIEDPKNLSKLDPASKRAVIEEQKTEVKKTVACQDELSNSESNSDKNFDQRKDNFENSKVVEKQLESDMQAVKTNDKESVESHHINETREKAGTKEDSTVIERIKTSESDKKSTSEFSEQIFSLEKEDAFEVKSQENASSDILKENSGIEVAVQNEIQDVESMETFEQDPSNLTHSRVTKTFQKVGSFSSEDSFVYVTSSSKATTDLPDDLANVDTVELDSLIQEKRDLFKQLEEKQKRYLKKMQRSSAAAQVSDECIEYPKIISVTDQESEIGQVTTISVACFSY
jgi:hypothetical protein